MITRDFSKLEAGWLGRETYSSHLGAVLWQFEALPGGPVGVLLSLHGRSGHNSDADLDLVLDFLRDQIAVKKEFLRIASMARSDEPYKEDERQCSKDAKELMDAMELKDATELKDTMDAWPNLLCIMESHPPKIIV